MSPDDHSFLELFFKDVQHQIAIQLSYNANDRFPLGLSSEAPPLNLESCHDLLDWICDELDLNPQQIKYNFSKTETAGFFRPCFEEKIAQMLVDVYRISHFSIGDEPKLSKEKAKPVKRAHSLKDVWPQKPNKDSS